MTLAGTEDYMAPEVTLGEDYDEKCDVFRYAKSLRSITTCVGR
jgi:serine/threonine protein kinase